MVDREGKEGVRVQGLAANTSEVVVFKERSERCGLQNHSRQRAVIPCFLLAAMTPRFYQRVTPRKNNDGRFQGEVQPTGTLRKVGTAMALRLATQLSRAQRRAVAWLVT